MKVKEEEVEKLREEGSYVAKVKQEEAEELREENSYVAKVRWIS